MCACSRKEGENIMTGTKKRSDGRYQIRFTVDGRRFSVYGKTLKEAREKADDKRHEIKEHGISSNSKISVQKYFEYWIQSKTGTVKDATIVQEKASFAAVLALIGNKKLSSIDCIAAKSVQAQLSASVSPSTVNYKMMILYSVCKAAVYDGILHDNPCKGVKPLRVTRRPARETIHRSLTKNELQAFFDACQNTCGDWYLELFRFLPYTGCRFGEATALQWSDIDLKNGMIHINRTVTRGEDGKRTTGAPKTQRSKRDIPLNASIESVLKKQKKQLADRFGKVTPLFVFVSPKGETVWASTINRQIRKSCEAIGLEVFSVHAFRDTFATMAIRQGMQPNTLKELLGHSSFSMTMDLYTHVLEDQKREEMEKIQILV